jgi:hypothetical protein
MRPHIRHFMYSLLPMGAQPYLGRPYGGLPC